jgi:hypothetical protein
MDGWTLVAILGDPLTGCRAGEHLGSEFAQIAGAVFVRLIEQTQQRVVQQWLASNRSSHHFNKTMTERAGKPVDGAPPTESPSEQLSAFQ